MVTLTTHKTLRGPRGGCILCQAELGPIIDKAVFPGLQGGPLEHVIAAKAVAFAEAAQPSFPSTPARSCANSAGPGPGPGRAWLPARLGRHGQPPDAGRPAHLAPPELTGKQAQEALDRAGITLNRNTIPDDPRPPFVTSGLRIGTPAVTTAGMREPEMDEIAALIDRALAGSVRRVRAPGRSASDVAVLCSKFLRIPSESCRPVRGHPA